mgnify:CR=1 FL=1
MTILRAADLAPPDLLRLLEGLAPPAGEKVRCWLDAPDGWALDYWHGPDGIVRWNGAGRDPCDEPLNEVLPRVMQGRIFSPSGELKWRLLPALGERGCRVVFLGDWASAALEALPLREELAALSRDEATYPLWGQQTKHTPGEWIDLRIPHRLRYPVDAKTPDRGPVIAKVKVEIWKDRRGEPQFIRLCDLTASWEE